MLQQAIVYNILLREHNGWSFKALLLSLLFFLSSGHLNAQQAHFREAWFNPDLPNEQVFSIYQDRRGCLWMATADGICQFDGKTPKILQVDPQLTNNSVFNFFERNPNQVWINTGANTLYFFDPLVTPLTSFPSNTTRL